MGVLFYVAFLFQKAGLPAGNTVLFQSGVVGERNYFRARIQSHEIEDPGPRKEYHDACQKIKSQRNTKETIPNSAQVRRKVHTKSGMVS